MSNICVKELGYAMIIVLGQMSYGSIVCYPSPAGKEIRAKHHLDKDNAKWSFYNSITALFAIAGSFVVTGLFILLKNSRKKVLFIIACTGAVFWFLNCLTKVSIGAGITMRAFLGVVVGAFSTIDPLYLVEISPKGASGFFGCLTQLGVCVGQVFFDFIGPSLSYMELNYVGGAMDVLLALLCLVIIESPIVEQLNNSKTKPSEEKKKETVFQKKYVIGLIYGILMMFFQQFCGINAILTDLADLMSRSGLKLDGNYQGGIATCSQIIAVFVSSLIVDKIGRRITWIISSAIIVVSLLIFALNEKYDWSNILPLICIFIYQFGFGLGLGPIPWFIIPELFDDSVASQAQMVTVASNWLFAFITMEIWPSMEKGMGMFGSMIFFMCISFAGLIFGIFCISEPNKDGSNNKDNQGNDDVNNNDTASEKKKKDDNESSYYAV